MRLVISGQKRFGRDVLELVLKLGHEVVAVSSPAIEEDRLRIGAANHRLPWIDAAGFNASTMPDGCDLILAAHCHSFLGDKTRAKAELGALGFHPSLLPLHRGRSAIEWALRFGERITGGSLYWLTDVVDGGPVAAQDWCFIQPGDTARDLWARELAPMGARLFARALADLERGVCVKIPQDQELVSWEPAIENVPRLWRPDLPLLGAARYQVVTERIMASEAAG